MVAMQRHLDQLRPTWIALTAQAREELEAVHRSYRKELVPVSGPGAVVVVTRRTRGSR